MRVFLACGSWFSWRGGQGHYQRLQSEVVGPITSKKTGEVYFEYTQRPSAPGKLPNSCQLTKLGSKTRKTSVKTVKRHQDTPKSKRLYRKYDFEGFEDLLLYMSKQPKISEKFGAEIPFYLKPLVVVKGPNKGHIVNNDVWYQANARRGASTDMIAGWMKKCCILAGRFFFSLLMFRDSHSYKPYSTTCCSNCNA